MGTILRWMHFETVMYMSCVGTDLDGAFGKEQAPANLETIADLQKVPLMLAKKGCSEQDIENIMSQNFIKFLQKVWK